MPHWIRDLRRYWILGAVAVFLGSSLVAAQLGTGQTTAPQVSLDQPAAASMTIAWPYTLRASTNVAVPSLEFVFAPPGGNQGQTFSGQTDAASYQMRWSRMMDGASGLPDGQYDLFARVPWNGATTESRHFPVYVRNSTSAGAGTDTGTGIGGGTGVIKGVVLQSLPSVTPANTALTFRATVNFTPTGFRFMINGQIRLDGVLDSSGIWTALWTPTAAGTYVVTAVAIDPQGETASAPATMTVSEPVQAPVQPTIPTVTLSALPPDGVMLGGEIRLGGVSTATNLEPGFLIVSDAGTAQDYANSGCVAGSQCLQWSGAWKPVVAGRYVVKARGRFGNDIAIRESDPATLTVSPPATAPSAAVPPAALTVDFTNVSDNATLTAVPVELSAKTSVAASRVVFHVTPKSSVAADTAVSTVSYEATPDAAMTGWTYRWTPVNGTYALAVSAIGTDKTEVAAPLPRTATVTVSVPSTETPSPAPTVRLSAPLAGDAIQVNTAVRLRGSSDSQNFSPGFLIIPENGSVIQRFANSGCVAGSQCLQWEGVWTPAVAGRYVIRARGSFGPNTKLVEGLSVPVTVTVAAASDQAQALSVVFVAPPDNATFAAVPIDLSARTNIAASHVVFRVTPKTPVAAGAVAPAVFFEATPDPSRTGWSFRWSPVNGTYELIVLASDVDGKEIVAPLPRTATVTIAASVQPAQPVEAPLGVKMRLPVSGAVVDGTLPLEAMTSAKSDILVFVVQGGGLSYPKRLIGVSGDQLAWKYAFDAASYPEGDYAVTAMATRGGREVKSEAVSFSIRRAAAAIRPPPTPPTATMPPISVMPPQAGTATESKPAIQFPPSAVMTPLTAVFLVLPAGRDLHGIVPFAAKTSGGASAVRFLVQPVLGGQAVFERDGVRSTDAPDQWSVMLDTTVLADGNYRLIVSATGADRSVVDQRQMTVANSVAAATIREESGPVPTPTISVEAVKQAVLEMPKDAIMLPTEPMPRPAAASIGENKDCAANRIPAAKCADWLNIRFTPPECRSAGIVTQEECAAYLKNLATGTRPEGPCAGKTTDECNYELTKRVAGLQTSDDFRTLQDAAFRAIGNTLVVTARPAILVPPIPAPRPSDTVAPQVPVGPPPSIAEPVTPKAPPSQDQLVQEQIPLVSEKAITVRVHASPEVARTQDAFGVRQMPAVVMIDSDGDGLPDDLEKRLGTDPFQKDSDGDGFDDWTEVKNGYNPLGPGKLSDKMDEKLAPVDRAVVAGVPLEQPRISGSADDKMEVKAVTVEATGQASRTRLTGRARPGEVVTIYIYSYLPVVITTTADESGNWTYDLDSGLSQGGHEAYVAVTDDTGRIQAKSAPLFFLVAEAQAQTPEEYFKNIPAAGAPSAQAPMARAFGWYIVGAALAVLFGIGFGAVFFLRNLKRGGD